MSQTPVTISYSLEEVLKEIKQSLDTIKEDVGHLKVGQAELKIKVEGLEKDVKEVKDIQGKQVWTLIGILFAAVGGFLVAVGRIVISGNP